MQEVRFKSVQTRLIEAKALIEAKETGPIVLADTFPREKESGENLLVPDLSSRKERSTDKSHDLLIQGLVNRLPEPDSVWSLNDRIKWLRTAANIFGLIYESSEGEDKEIKLVLAKDDQ